MDRKQKLELTWIGKENRTKLEQLEGRIEAHDEQIVAIFEAIRQLMKPPERPRKKIYPVKFKLAA